MKCFVHRDTDALGVCKNCNRGVCDACLTEVSDGLACAGRCEEQAVFLGSLMARHRKNFRAGGLGGITLSLVFLAFGIYIMAWRDIVFGGFLVVSGTSYFLMCAMPLLRRVGGADTR